MPILAAILFLLAVVAVTAGAAALLGRLPRNRWVGVRTAGTLDNEDVFRSVNRLAAPTMLAAGLILALGAGGALALGGLFGIAAALTAVVAAIFTAGAGASAAAQTAIPKSAKGPCGDACGSCSLRGAC